MSKSGVVAGVGAMGIVYLMALPIATAALFAVVAAVAAVVVLVGILATAGRVWLQQMRIATYCEDWGYVRDLCLVPASAISAAALFGSTVYELESDVDKTSFMHAINDNSLLGMTVPLVGFALVVSMFVYGPRLLLMPPPWRLFSYPAYIFFAIELTTTGTAVSEWPSPF